MSDAHREEREREIQRSRCSHVSARVARGWRRGIELRDQRPGATDQVSGEEEYDQLDGDRYQGYGGESPVARSPQHEPSDHHADTGNDACVADVRPDKSDCVPFCRAVRGQVLVDRLLGVR